MTIDVRQTSLMRFLAASHPSYFGKAIELRETVCDWLSYIPQSFPHYTRHTVPHSDEIISSISAILFIDNDPRKPALRDLSGVEAYILVAAAYLHDAGMTVSDREKATILQSGEWRSWVTEGGGATRSREIQSFRQGVSPAEETTRHFLADVQLRFLIAEFIRRTHHVRSADLLVEHQEKLGRFAFDDVMLRRTIADVCLAHGLRQHELNERERFPDRRDIRGEKANVRLLAILLRLGDLLDMSQDRACPLLLNVASPVPADSLAHWTQYQRITHKMVAHDRIELCAECASQDEHRFLHDWCDWLVKELRQAGLLMSRSLRHSEWIPPYASLEEPDRSIEIRPAKGALYIPSLWRFELDAKAVFDRLIYDAFDHPTDFLRELLQNAADATRCKLYSDLQNEGGSVPPYPTQIAEERRAAYPVHVRLSTVDVLNELSGEWEQRQVVTVEDFGIGMDREVVERYLLQVGRSFYTTREFRDRFGFVASSRFGVGFLSVFAASDDVVIETLRLSGTSKSEPLRLRLTGPRSYLLTERGKRRVSGTSITAILRTPLKRGEVTELVRRWCGRLEFPVFVNDLGVTSEIRAERAERMLLEAPDLSHKDAKLEVRAFPIDREGIEGELFVFVRVFPEGEDWTSQGWAKSDYANTYPQAIVPVVPSDAVFFHGIRIDRSGARGDSRGFSARIDLRGERFEPTLARTRTRSQSDLGQTIPEVTSRWDELLQEHIASNPLVAGPKGWSYKQFLSQRAGSDEFWKEVPGAIPVLQDGIESRVSMAEMHRIEVLHIALERRPASDKKPDLPLLDGCLMFNSWVDRLSTRYQKALFSGRTLEALHWGGEFLVCVWRVGATHEKPAWKDKFIALEHSDNVIGGVLHNIGSASALLVNSRHAFGAWYIAVKQACENGLHGLTEDHLERLQALLMTPLRLHGHDYQRLQRFVAEWRNIPGLPEALLPPAVEMRREDFDVGTIGPAIVSSVEFGSWRR